MIKKLITLALLVACAATANARSLVIVLSDSTKVYFLLDEKPVMKVTDETITIGTREFQFNSVEKFYISNTDDPTGIESQLARQKVKFDGNQVVIDGNKKVEIYNAGGVKQDIDVSKAADMTVVNISALPRGTYIMHVGKSSVKFNKK